MSTLDLANHGPVIPVIVINKVEDAVPMAEALLEGGIKVLEVTLRSSCALQAMEAIAKAVPDAILGSGTVRSIKDAQASKDVGCQFAVSPGYTSELGKAAREMGLPLLPGVSTGSEIMMANADDYYFLKLFPAVAVGGINLLKGFAGPFGDVKFCPTGGVTVDSASQFLALPNVVVCGGTWLTPADAVAAKDWKKITQLAKEASAIKAA
ncbi:MAG: bifunctional 4-hydroxy-2-oxoglutarate aldolase/2-dehydro-3-deoxy-phosphogluconate aldolase [Nitrosomonadales bacterium]|nr:bifunctional 4-hydroxy-2-oxoglutarate aldolase/2-dehydro-3-deoxy-phosphogluconate aldolase [Nitrosomonadales bacterium]